MPEEFEQLGKTPADCARLLADIGKHGEGMAAVLACKTEWGKLSGAVFETALFRCAAEHNAARIETLPLPDSVKALLRDEFKFYSRAALPAGSPEFVAAAEVVSLRRFPAGPLEFEVGGFPRSWLPQARLQFPKLLGFMSLRVGGFGPLFFIHVARRPKNRSLVLEKEVMRAYFRVAHALELQPEIKGILAAAWFHDPAAVEHNPHLAWLNRPYLEGGGMIVTLGPAPADAGFLEHNAARKEQLEGGALRYRIGAAIWPRDAAIRWAQAHPEWES